jgi:hypothetical protein
MKRQNENGNMKEALSVQDEFERAAGDATWDAETLKQIVTHRLAKAVVEGKPSNVAREAELIGKMKGVDLFVRNADVQVGIFANLLEPRTAETIDNLAATIREERPLDGQTDAVMPLTRKEQC